ncbi:group III truncated hemoglobin [Dyella sp. A6]|uniref:group III truncated hemoglobin n=1 Tax=Dyella aluminiiresistens TaxID=3069105 RepID=UPI002E79DD0F|nr:group III truncated hemoglobin [Dyella sp. A6]
MTPPYHSRMTAPHTLDETGLAYLVDHFYDKVRGDPLIGPVFNAAVHDWAEHKRLLTSFWCSVALGAASYRGQPMAVHRKLPSIRGEHFERWLTLWRETTRQLLGEADAARMIDYAERIGRSLRMGMGLRDGRLSRPLGISVIQLPTAP